VLFIFEQCGGLIATFKLPNEFSSTCQAKNLQLAKQIDTGKMYAPSFMMIVTAVGQYAYQREDGVYVVPIGCLKD